jgi:hypothetical protein
MRLQQRLRPRLEPRGAQRAVGRQRLLRQVPSVRRVAGAIALQIERGDFLEIRAV